MTTQIQTEPDLLLIADLYRLVSKALSYPDPESIKAISDIALMLSDSEMVTNELASMLKTVHEESNEDAVRNEYSRIFLSGGLPISESFCTGRFDCISDVSGFYKAFGFTPKSGDVPDSIMYELEFLSLLLVKIMIAPDKESKEISTNAFSNFYKQHLSDFMVKFTEKLMSYNPSSYFIAVMNVLKETVSLQTQIKQEP